MFNLEGGPWGQTFRQPPDVQVELCGNAVVAELGLEAGSAGGGFVSTEETEEEWEFCPGGDDDGWHLSP